MLIGKDQHGIFCERLFDGRKVGRSERRRKVDVADLGDKTRRDRTNSDGHEQILGVGPPPRYLTLTEPNRGVAPIALALRHPEARRAWPRAGHFGPGPLGRTSG